MNWCDRIFQGADVGKLKDDYRAGRVGGEQILKLIERLVQRLNELQKQLGDRACG